MTDLLTSNSFYIVETKNGTPLFSSNGNGVIQQLKNEIQSLSIDILYIPHIAKFIERAVRDGLQIICQCDYGQSRSAACATAILEHYENRGIDIFRDYRYYPNQLIFNKIYAALQSI